MNTLRKAMRVDLWRIAPWVISSLTILPLAVILSSWFMPTGEIWSHMADNLLGDLIHNSVVLCTGVILLTAILGTSLAWLTGACDFPGRKFFGWALLLPFAMPSYVLAFVFLGIFDFTGPVQTYMRTLFGGSLRLPDMRSSGAVILVLSLSLYPYVYLLARGAFMSQGGRIIEAARSLGSTTTSSFFRVALPMARPWIVGGLFLVLMETLADFGAVSIFNYDTFTTAIYKAWYGFFTIEAAAQLSSILVGIVLLVILLEKYLRRRLQYTESAKVTHKAVRIRLHGAKKWLALIYALLVFSFAFLLPFIQLFVWSWEILPEMRAPFGSYLLNSLVLAFMAAALICFLALILAYSQRINSKGVIPSVVRLATLGYALPGTVLAVGLVFVVNMIDAQAAQFFAFLGVNKSTFLQGTVLTMLLAYAVRFMAAGLSPTQSALQRVTASIDEAARSLGVTGFSLIRKIHIPVVRKGLLTAAILVFVDVMKEMPITLMTRPFGWDTLAVKIYEYTSEGEWQLAALPAVALIVGGIIPVIFLTNQMERS